MIPTLFEDEWLLAVVKPAGIDTGNARAGSSPGLAETLADVRGKGERLHATNRLSRYESGILLLAKQRPVADLIRKALKTGKVQSEYAAVVTGRLPGTKALIDRRQKRGPAESRRRRQSESRWPEAGGQPGLSSGGRAIDVRVVSRGEKRALVRCRGLVENTHALRAALRSAKMRLLGDSIHDTRARPSLIAQTCLHLSKMVLRHPATAAGLDLKAPAPDGFAAESDEFFFIERAMHAGLIRRLRCLSEHQTNCFRLLSGDHEDLPGLVAERFGPVAILQLQTRPRLLKNARAIATWYRRTLGLQAVYVRIDSTTNRPVDHEPIKDFDPSQPLVGQGIPEPIEVLERGLRFAIRPSGGRSVGLFLDQRENRGRIRGLAAGKEVLNLFAYTSAFSVAAAAGGAKRTVSVDVSRRHLEWARENFNINGLNSENHQLVRMGALDFLKRARRRGDRFDVVILDPPTFAHGRRGEDRFSISEDLLRTVNGAVALLNPAGLLLLSTNYRRMSLRDLRASLSKGASGRAFEVLETPPLPADFAMDPDHAKSLLARFE